MSKWAAWPREDRRIGPCHAAWLLFVVLLATGCGIFGGDEPSREANGGEELAVASGPSEEPPEGAAEEFDTDFDKHNVPYSGVLSGGPPKDGIRAIDEPRFVSIRDAGEWLEGREPVILLRVAGEVRAYPIQVIMWHEIVNDTVGGVPVTVTFCPLCER